MGSGRPSTTLRLFFEKQSQGCPTALLQQYVAKLGPMLQNVICTGVFRKDPASPCKQKFGQAGLLKVLSVHEPRCASSWIMQILFAEHVEPPGQQTDSAAVVSHGKLDLAMAPPGA